MNRTYFTYNIIYQLLVTCYVKLCVIAVVYAIYGAFFKKLVLLLVSESVTYWASTRIISKTSRYTARWLLRHAALLDNYRYSRNSTFMFTFIKLHNLHLIVIQ